MSRAQPKRALKVPVLTAQGRVCVAVEDQGIGFTPATGWQAGATHFGLDSVHERMRILGGDCMVQSEPGRGDTRRISTSQVLTS